MKKLNILFSIILFLSISGCKTLKPSYNNRNTLRNTNGYLSQGIQFVKPRADLTNKNVSSGEPDDNNNQSNIKNSDIESMTKTDLKKELLDMKLKLEKETIQKNELKHKYNLLKINFQKKMIKLTFDLENQKQTAEDYKTKALNAEIKAIRAEQELSEVKVNLVSKMSTFNSGYPAFYEIKNGDSLWKIAGKKEIYQNPYKWQEILFANKDKISNKNMIFAGVTLKIPRYYEVLLSNFSQNSNISEKKQTNNDVISKNIEPIDNNQEKNEPDTEEE